MKEVIPRDIAYQSEKNRKPKDTGSNICDLFEELKKP